MAARCDRVVSFGRDEPQDGHFGLRTVDGVTYLARGETLLLSVRELAMYGVHNQLNALAALAAGDLLGLEMSAMLQVLVEFPGLPHRMQFVARIGAVDYVNDSKAANVAAAVASINSVDSMLVAGLWLSAGVHLPFERFEIWSDVRGGGSFLSLGLVSEVGDCVARTTWNDADWLLDVRLGAEGFVSPHVSVGGWGGYAPLAEQPWSGGAAITVHIAPYDGVEPLR